MSATTVVFCCDEAYAPHAAVALESLLQCTAGGQWQLLLVGNLPAVWTDQFQRQVERHGRRIELLPLESVLANHPLTELLQQQEEISVPHISASALSRLLLPDLLTDQHSRLLYLDCDLMVQSTLQPLLELEIGQHALAAAPDALIGPHLNHQSLRFPAEHHYFNSGVLLIERSAWKQRGMSEQLQLLTADQRFRGRWLYPDQDLLNLLSLTTGGHHQLSSRWNHQVIIGREASFHSIPEPGVEDGDIAVVHCAGEVKPWKNWYPNGSIRERYWQLRRSLDLPVPCEPDQPATQRDRWIASGLFERCAAQQQAEGGAQDLRYHHATERQSPETTAMTTRPVRVRIALPHFFKEVEGGTGYGSGKPGARLARSIALGRCLSSLLDLRRSHDEALLDIGEKGVRRWPAQGDPRQRTDTIQVEVNVFTNGDNCLGDVLALYGSRIRVHRVDLENPRLLPIHARNWLINTRPDVELSLYLEDDLVINDPLFVDKQLWFLGRTDHKGVLMPHRYEPSVHHPSARVLVDGPLRADFIGRYCRPQRNAASGKFDPRSNQEISFDITDNPHSGCFVLSYPQIAQLREKQLPEDGFIGPLETAATFTVLQHFPVFKPSAGHQRFLEVEHGHPSFLSYLNTWKELA